MRRIVRNPVQGWSAAEEEGKFVAMPRKFFSIGGESLKTEFICIGLLNKGLPEPSDRWTSGNARAC